MVPGFDDAKTTECARGSTTASACGRCRRTPYQRLPVQERFELCGCLHVAIDGIAPGPMHAGTPAASGGVGRPAFLSRGGAAAGMLLPCGPVNHTTMRNRTQRVAADLEAAVSPTPEPDPDLSTEIVMAIDGAHIRAAHGYQSRYIDVTVGKIEVAGNHRDALLLRRRVRSRLWRRCATRFAKKDGGPAEPRRSLAMANRRFRVWSAPRSASPSPAFWTGGTSRCGFSLSSKRCVGSMPSSPGIGRGWKSSIGELGG
jgi:hypothetical protein